MKPPLGFTLPVVLAVIVLTAIAASSAMSDSLLNQTLATTHTLQNRAFSTAERALEIETHRIQLSAFCRTCQLNGIALNPGQAC
jgi:Tfp pilus assembly protein PilX